MIAAIPKRIEATLTLITIWIERLMALASRS